MPSSKLDVYLKCFYRDRMTLNAIGKLCGVSLETVRRTIIIHDPCLYIAEKQSREEERFLSRHEKKPHEPRKHPIKEMYARHFYEERMTLMAIARLFDVSITAVRKSVLYFGPEAYLAEKKRRAIERLVARNERAKANRKILRSAG